MVQIKRHKLPQTAHAASAMNVKAKEFITISSASIYRCQQQLRMRFVKRMAMQLFCLSKCLVFGVAWSNMREHFLCEHISFWRACVPFDISIQFRINSIYMRRARERMKLEKWTVLVHSMLHRRVSSRWFRLALKACWPHKRLGCREPTHDA